MGVRVIAGGLLTTVQDLGRFGYQKFGFSPSGAMDEAALRIANLLVGNEPGEAALEATLLGPTLEFLESAVIALTGADMGARISGQPIPRYAAISVSPGDVLAFDGLVSGVRAYIAFAGGLAIEPVMGSRSTHVKCAVGGYAGRALRPGDEIGLRAEANARMLAGRRLDAQAFDDFDAPALLRIIPGPQADLFRPEALTVLTGQPYAMTAQSDRMGARLSGPSLEHVGGADIISDGIALGAIQVPPHGQPIVMLADRQTTGGYAKIGTVISADIPILAQSKAGRALRFALTTPEAARRERIRQIRRFEALKDTLDHPSLLRRMAFAWRRHR